MAEEQNGQASGRTWLVSVDFRAEAGGISRVARYMAQAMPFSEITSFYGTGHDARYFAGKRLPFLLYTAFRLLTGRFSTVVFDHLGIASLLAFYPLPLRARILIFLHDEEAWVPLQGRHAAGARRAHLFLCNSQFTYERFVKANPSLASKARLCLLGGVPEQMESPAWPREQVPLPDKPFFLYVSRLWKRHTYKGYNELIQAWSILPESVRQSHRLVLVGRGDAVPGLRTQWQSFIQKGELVISDTTSDYELATLYRQAQAFILPSTMEGFGFVYLEAMAAGCPCCGLETTPAREIIVDGETGWLLPDNRPETLGAQMAWLATHPEVCRTAGEKAFTRYHAQFTSAHFRNRFLHCLRAGTQEPL